MDEQYQDGDKIKGREQNDWVRAWWHWFLSIDEDSHPTFSPRYVGRHEYDDSQGHVPSDMTGSENKVWNIPGGYGPTANHRSILRLNGEGWAIVATVYVDGVSVEEFPSLRGKDDQDTFNNLLAQARQDVGRVYEAVAKLDGMSLEPCYLETGGGTAASPAPFIVRGLPRDNVIDVPQGEIHMVSVGYWVFIKPLAIGDHLLELTGYSNNYAVQTRHVITVREPGTSM